jgi:hypothetical protein
MVDVGLTAIGEERFCIFALGSVALPFELRALLVRRFMTRDGKGRAPLLVLTRTPGISAWHKCGITVAWLHWALKEGIIGRSSRKWRDTLVT